MNFYEHTIIARQDTSSSQLKQLQDKYVKIVEKYDGNVVKTENWGLLNLSYLIKKNRKGNYIHFKLEGTGKTVSEHAFNAVIGPYAELVSKQVLQQTYLPKSYTESVKDFYLVSP